MSSIVIFIIFVVVSMVFQALKQEGNRNRQQAAPRVNRPAMQPTVAPHRSPSNQNMNKTQGNRMQPNVNPVKMANQNIEAALDPEGVQTEGPTNNASLQPQKTNIEPVKEPHAFDIDINDLQKSIIMAEVLGKPKALRK